MISKKYFLASGKVTDRSGNGLDAQIVGTVGVGEGIARGKAGFFSGNGYLIRSNCNSLL